MILRKRLRRWLPSPDSVRGARSLAWLRPLLRRPFLWQLTRRRVAAGAAIGVFFGFAIPIAQILGAAVFALLLRANLPVAAVATLVSNPLTYAPIAVAAYHTGAALLGRQADPAEAAALASAGAANDPTATPRWPERILAAGKPLVVGLLVFAVAGAAVAWVAVNVAWIAAVRLRRRQSLRQRAPPPTARGADR
jgi:uncharacterized protein (DUF2062 family)